jgi:hypothetical protein
MKIRGKFMMQQAWTVMNSSRLGQELEVRASVALGLILLETHFGATSEAKGHQARKMAQAM